MRRFLSGVRGRALIAVAFSLALATAAPAAASAASACRSGAPPSTREYFADFTAGPRSRTSLFVTPFKGTLTSLSFRSIRDVAVRVAPGQALGTVRFGDVTYPLKAPRKVSSDGRYVVFRKSFEDGAVTTVTMRTSASKYRVVGCAVPLSIAGLPAGAKSVGVVLAPGVLGPDHACPASPTLGLYAQLRGAAPLALRSGIRC